MKQPKNILIPFALFYCLLDFFESGCDDPRLFEVCRDALRTKCDSLLQRDIYSQLLSARDPAERARLAGQYMLSCAGIFGDDGSDGSQHQSDGSDGSQHHSDGSDGSQHHSDGSDGSQHQSDGSSFGCDPHCSAYGLERDELCSAYCCPIYDRSF